MSFLVFGRPSSRAHERAQPTSLEALLVTTKRPGGIAKAARDIVLISVSRFKKLNHSIGFGRAIVDGVVSKDNTLDEHHSLFFFGLQANAIVDEDGTRRWTRLGKQLRLR